MKFSSNDRKPLSAARLKMLEHEYNAAWGSRDLERCFHLLHQVLELNKRSVNAHLLLGRLHGTCYEYDKAIECFEKALEVSPKKDEIAVLIEAGNMAGGFFDPTIAEEFFQEAVDASGDAAAKLALAEYSMRLRRNGEARILIDEVVETTPGDPVASLLWCRIHEDRLEECLRRLDRLMTVPSAELRAKAGYQLAKVLDGLGDYDGAMGALAVAKAGLMSARDIVVEPRANVRIRHNDLARSFNHSLREQWEKNAELLGDSRKLALLCGHPRSGTTLLEQVLDSHPDVVSAEETENFSFFAFGPLLRRLPPATSLPDALDSFAADDLRSARNSYFDSMDACLGEPVGSRLLVDKNPSLTSLVPVMCRFFPESRFIAMIRDPRDVILSCYMQSFVPVSAISGNYLTLEDAAAEYAGVMDVWTEMAPHLEGRACEVRYEDMVEDLEGHAKRVLGFLELNWDESVMNYDQHAREKVVRSPTANAVTEKVHRRAKNRWKNYEKYLAPAFDILAPSLKKLGYD